MKIRNPSRPNFASSRGGWTLIECLVYMAVFFLVLSLAYATLYRTWEQSRTLTRTTEDITRAINAGELWRQDVRSATGSLRIENSAGGQSVYIPQKSGEIRYSFSQGELRRYPAGNTPWTPVLSGIKSSRMSPDSRKRVAAWRWELELNPRQKTNGRFPPLFTFEAASNPEATP